MRLSPFDSWTWAAFDAQATRHLLRGRYEEACRTAYKSVQANAAHSITCVQLTAALAKLGRLEEAGLPPPVCSSFIQRFATDASLRE